MKREIKRLQRLRDIFRQNTNNPAILEQNRLVEARKLIETVSVFIQLRLKISSLVYQSATNNVGH